MTDATPPGLPQAPMTSNDGLKVGDVVEIAVMLQDKTTGQSFWWKRFAVDTRLVGKRILEALTLKMHPDMDKDLRMVSYALDDKERPQVVTRLREPWPQGVAAMHMKLLAQGVIRIADD